MNECKASHPWVKDYCRLCGWKPPRVIAQGPVVDISEPGEAPVLRSANRAARRAAKAHARWAAKR